ncbi:hypothetical protein MPTK1_1g09190 [Marchantia polymorpha subsp. ruderalis]|uniref:Uncharacterized protein n=1 Tax=Marchantia polymorpha subsp. ruderalis TaxID=1480154 RepID=A0AAF6AN69_MARPO|nr:hypothetical protein Mp_1g09190 [Marchantia polymorpha subsp. ruderalis]
MPNLTSLWLSNQLTKDICPEIKFSGKPPDIAILEEEYNVSTRRWDCSYSGGPTPVGHKHLAETQGAFLEHEGSISLLGLNCSDGESAEWVILAGVQ